MGKISDRYFPEPDDFKTYVDMGPDQEYEEYRSEASGLLSFVAISLFVGAIAILAGVASGRI